MWCSHSTVLNIKKYKARIARNHMEKELLDFASRNSLSPFNKLKTSVKSVGNSVLKTKDARAIYTKVLSKISSNFLFADTSNFLMNFPFTLNNGEILRRQHFFKGISSTLSNNFLKGLKLDRVNWRPPYSILVVTEDDKTFLELQKMGCPVKILANDQDVLELEEMDIVQVIDCENYSRILERLPQSIYLGRIEEAYLERHVELLSRWSDILKILKNNQMDFETDNLVNETFELLPLLLKEDSEKITKEKVEFALEEIKEEIAESVKEMTVQGSALIEILSKGVVPEELKAIVGGSIARTGLPSELFFHKFPVEIDEAELDKILRKQSLNEFAGIAQKIKGKSKELYMLPKKLQELEKRLLVYDFKAGVSNWMDSERNFPTISERFSFEDASNILIENPKPISFNLNEHEKCSILTGANSGGKTTLLEHILQAISCMQIGLPFSGKVGSPVFSEIYYFAKNKGSMSKGAFETLLTQMSEINPGSKTLILADEIEAVTEPGVAGKMICATAEYFITRGCYLVIATHLGHEIAKNLPTRARIDGIEATGISEDNELIVNHNPVLGRLAHSTPELIIEKMVRSQGGEYFGFLHERVKNSS
jgi:DNA mismatch repair protein MutS2